MKGLLLTTALALTTSAHATEPPYCSPEERERALHERDAALEAQCEAITSNPNGWQRQCTEQAPCTAAERHEHAVAVAGEALANQCAAYWAGIGELLKHCRY